MGGFRIPDSLLAQATGKAGTGEPDHETHSALAAARSAEQEMTSLNRALTLTSEALKTGDKVSQRLATAHDALGKHGDGGALRWLLDHVAAERTRQETATSRSTAMRTLIGTIKGVGTLPMSLDKKAELGRTLLQRSVELGIVGPEQHRLFEDAVISQFSLAQAQTAIANATEPGEALAILANAEGEAVLQPMDSALLRRQAKERDAIATARHKARLLGKEQDDLAAFARGELPEPLSESSFTLLHGEKGAVEAHARYQAARKEGEAIAAIRGKSAAGIEMARAEWADDPEIFNAAAAKDAQARLRDPVGYALITVPGAKAAWKELPAAERGALLWSAQAAAGIPPHQSSPWTVAEEGAMAAEWDALPDGHAGRNEKLSFFRRYLLGLSPSQRPAAIHRLVYQGIVDGTEAQIAQIVTDIENGLTGPARRASTNLSPVAEMPAVDQEALSRTSEDSAAEQAEEAFRTSILRDSQPLDVWALQLMRLFYDTPDFTKRLIIHDVLLDQVGIPDEGFALPLTSAADVAALMRVQNVREDAWRLAKPAPEEMQRGWANWDNIDKEGLIYQEVVQSQAYFVGPDDRLYLKEGFFEANAAWNVATELASALVEQELEIAAEGGELNSLLPYAMQLSMAVAGGIGKAPVRRKRTIKVVSEATAPQASSDIKKDADSAVDTNKSLLMSLTTEKKKSFPTTSFLTELFGDDFKKLGNPLRGHAASVAKEFSRLKGLAAEQSIDAQIAALYEGRGDQVLKDFDALLPSKKRATADTVVVQPGTMGPENGENFIRYRGSYLDPHHIVLAVESKSGRAKTSEPEENLIAFMHKMDLHDRHLVARVSAPKIDANFLYDSMLHSDVLRRYNLLPDRERFISLFKKHADNLPIILFLAHTPSFLVEEKPDQ